MTTCMENGCSPAVAGNVFVGVLFCAVLYSHKMYWMRSGTELSQLLKIFPTYSVDYFWERVRV